MDIVTRRFIAIGNRIVAELRRLSDSIQQHINATREASQARDQQYSPPPEVRAVLDAPHGVETRKSRSDAEDDQHHQRLTLLVSWLTLFAIVGYSIIMYYQLREMISSTGATQQAVQEARLNRQQSEKALNAAIEQFHLDQRAWVAVVQMGGIPEISKPWKISVRARNTGKTFAESLHGTGSAEPVPKGQYPDFSRTPSTTSPITVAVLAPGADFDNVLGDPKGENINQVAIDNFTQGRIVEFVYGKLSYRDVFGCPHWTEYCYILGADLRWVGCSVHNSADNNTCQKK